MSTNYNNYDVISWSLGTPITAGRLQQMTNNISEVKDATDTYAKGVLTLNTVTAQVADVHTGLGDSEVAIVTIDATSGPGPTDQRITLEENRYYKLCLHLPYIHYSTANASTYYTLKLIQTAGVSVTTLATYKIMSEESHTEAWFGGGTYSHLFDTSAGSTTQHAYKATIVRNSGSSGAYDIGASSTHS